MGLEYEQLKSKCREMDTTVGSGRVLNSKTMAHHSQKKLLIGSLLYTRLVLMLNVLIVYLFIMRDENLARLWDIHSVYSWIDKDIGCCQGMSDLCSPISIILEHEADAFWCFERLMCRVRGNFKSTSTSIGVRAQLTTLSTIMKSVDPKLHEHLENLDGGEYLFAFRMLMVLFRREFSFVDTMYLWELMWSMEYNPNLFSMLESGTGTSSANTKDESVLGQCGKFERKTLQAAKKDDQIPLSVFVVASVIEARNKKLLGEAKGLDDVVKILSVCLSPSLSIYDDDERNLCCVYVALQTDFKRNHW
ncbi:rab GTPase-activating protein 22-like isoform X7 [Miscanthus floridulus]|uniref:rab GTPase-activating protein 22-like isoform X7 n=1 Tax=Miscanthus floridulus TaxID=154761 RepID=UPI0034588EE6